MHICYLEPLRGSSDPSGPTQMKTFTLCQQESTRCQERE